MASLTPRLRALSIWLLLGVTCPYAAFAQPLDRIVVGVVTAADGQAIAGVTVTLTGRGLSRSAISDARGLIAFGTLPGGVYAIVAQARGFARVSGRSIVVRADGPTQIELTLVRSGASSLLTIADVAANGVPALSTLPAPSVNINARTYAAQGVTRVSDILEDALSTTVYPVIGGGLNAPAVVALRGPDPSETLVDVDGHQVNNGNTGDFDLSLLDPADLESVQVLYGIAPSALFGPNTLGGALNVVTLDPTLTPQSLERFSYGSYGTFTGTLQATGSEDRLGYALSVHRLTSAGELDDAPFSDTSNASGLSSGTSPVGNDMSALSDIAKLRYSFGNGGFINLSFRDQAVYRDLSATLSSIGPPTADYSMPTYSNFSGSSIASNDDAYGLDVDLPLGSPSADGTYTTTMLFRHQTSLVSQVVNGGAAGASPYLYNDRDLIADDTLELDRQLSHAEFSVKVALTDENLVTDNILGVIYADDEETNPVAQYALRAPADSVTSGDALATVQHLGQTQRWIGARYTDDPTPQLHYSFATYYSDYSSFGHSTDPRFGFVWTPTASSALRASVGSTFQSPQLPTFIVPGTNQPIPVVGGYASIGNPNATAERSTEYDIGYEHLFDPAAHQVRASLDLYRTDLHNGVATFYGPQQCTAANEPAEWPDVDLAENPPCLSYPVNVTREVYQGLEARADVELARSTTLHVAYDVDSVYTQSAPPASLDGVVLYEQALGVPLHKLSLAVEQRVSPRFSYYAGLLYEGQYNELDLPPFATLRAGVTWRVRDYDLTLAGENLTDAYDFLYTRAGGGISYGALPEPIATDAYPLPGRRITLIVTKHSR